MPQSWVCCPLVVLVFQHGAVELVFFQCQETCKPTFLFPSPLLLHESERELEGMGGVGGHGRSQRSWEELEVEWCKCGTQVQSVALSSALTLKTNVGGPERKHPTLSECYHPHFLFLLFLFTFSSILTCFYFFKKRFNIFNFPLFKFVYAFPIIWQSFPFLFKSLPLSSSLHDLFLHLFSLSFM